MNYIPLDLEKALNGAPIAMIWGAYNVQKGYLHKSKNPTAEFHYLIEIEETGKVVLCAEDTVKNKARMWEKPIIFEYWDILDERISCIEKRQERWIGWFASYDGDYRSLGLKESIFPDCPIGTIIKRPD